MKSVFKLILLILCAFTVLSGCDDTSPPSFIPNYDHPGANVIDVDLSRQQTEVWCWAAVIEMVSGYYGNYAPQCSTLSWWYGYNCCAYPNFCATTGTDYQIHQSFQALGIGSQYLYTPLTWQQCVTEIEHGRPFIMFYRGSFAGHVVVAFGVNTEKQTLFIHDPYYGTFEVPYGNSFSYNGSMSWQQTLYHFYYL